MTDKLDLSLDDIIKINKQTNPRRGRGKGFRQSRGGVGQARNTEGRGRSGSYNRNRGPPSGKWDHDMYKPGPQRSAPVSSRSGKLLVSNLDFGVSDSDVTELFSEFGALRRAAVHYDRSGRSLGIADVHFERSADAQKAQSQYNGVPLDGRPMEIRFVEDQSSGRVLNGTGGGSRGGYGGYRDAPRYQRGSFGRGRGRGRGRGGRQQRKEVSAEELDKQLDDYVSQTD